MMFYGFTAVTIVLVLVVCIVLPAVKGCHLADGLCGCEEKKDEMLQGDSPVVALAEDNRKQPTSSHYLQRTRENLG